MTVEKTGVLKHMRLCVVFAGSLACVQSLVWMVLTLFGIIFYWDCSPPTNFDFDAYFGSVLRQMYFIDDSCTGSELLHRQQIEYMESQQMLIWSYVYLGMSTCWLVSSVLLVKYVRWERVTSALPFMYVWCIFTLAMSVVDLALGALLGRDMGRISAYASSSSSVNDDNILLLSTMKTASGVLMTVVLRGYVLWVANVCSAAHLAACISSLQRGLSEGGNYQHSVMTRGPLAAYDSSIEARSSQWLASSGGLERPHLKRQRSLHRSNSQYQGDCNPAQHSLGESYPAQQNLGESNPAFARSNNNINSHSSEPKLMPWERAPQREPYTPGRDPPPSSSDPKLMPWERAPQREPYMPSRDPSGAPKPMPWERAAQGEPYTPSPDYSPPAARAARSALKPAYSNMYKR